MFTQLENQLKQQASAVLLVVRGNKTLFSYGDVTQRYPCHSMRKSFLSALIGCAVAEGRFDLSLTLHMLGIDDRESLSAREKQATLYDLLTARSGISHPANYETAWMQRIKPPRDLHAPGENWCYSNWDFNVLGSAFRQLTGEAINQAFAHRIAAPTGMQDYRVDRDSWLESGDVSDHPAYPFTLSSRDLLRFGQLFLRQGRWNDQQVIPAHWTRTSTLPVSHAGDRGAYGYMWWVTRDGIAWPEVILPAGSYSARGAGGHFCLVMPGQDLVIVHRVDTRLPGQEVNRFQSGTLLHTLLTALEIEVKL
ncbi:class C beta-lactamase-related serine hydrolase [Candidatus Pantoea deserta]|uniref:Class C beta-lactamase-related serine hydrolase n=1 Tax=Candidatus Pantoea deserta TaxID=1869313 RepID=A0A3N4NHK1_9GAMM|nr:serine hydrolase [Pantoea deserta]RPD95892.1 class C beta-lactamase-related serine hydrolase [Pantoea deserta]